MEKERLFDVTIGFIKFVEVCKLVGILSFISFHSNETKRMCLYRNDGLAVFKTITGLQAEKMENHFWNNSVKMI